MAAPPGGLLGGVLPPELAALCLNILNYAMFAGGLLIKLPQIILILRTQTVKGMSETSLTTEFLACCSLCAYNLLMGHPFKTWGEMSLIGAQCGIQILLFWCLTTENLRVWPRILSVIALAACFTALGLGLLPAAFYPVLGLVQSVLGSFARVPQIIMNFRQRHTGNQSVLTWGLSLGGNVIRVITTLASVDDFIAVLGYLIALTLNLTLVLQILFFWRNTINIISGESKRKD